jgi:mycoredoxin
LSDPADMVVGGQEILGVVEVFWRPGCGFCAALRRDLKRRGIASSWHDIWSDESARAYVRSVNAGN